uniref:Putative serine/threonine protein kinase n=1 Tax=Pithovirus LCPAC202 TaxID=2506592 RepID=A0A481Z817_9VIRU|nr:MAG: putative serine/threonine protein kinase [Pithovirus LCPAC202]
MKREKNMPIIEIGNNKKYELLSILAVGTSGNIFKGEDIETGRIVAIKIKTKISSLTRAEGTILSLLNHPNIVELVSYNHIREIGYIVMGYANSGDLHSYINERKIKNEYQARNIFQQISRGLCHAHSVNICHRDIKPENIIIFDQTRFVLGDWGFATSFSRKRGHVQRCGSLGFCSPELLLGKPYIGPEVDIWALGVTLYTLMEGRCPFFGIDVDETVDLIVNGLYIIPFNWSDELADLFSRMLTINPKERITINQILEHPWMKLDESVGCYSNNYLRKKEIIDSPSVSTWKSRPLSNSTLSHRDGRTSRFLRQPSIDIIKREAEPYGNIPVVPLLDFLAENDEEKESTKKTKLSKLSPRSLWRSFRKRN